MSRPSISIPVIPRCRGYIGRFAPALNTPDVTPGGWESMFLPPVRPALLEPDPEVRNGSQTAENHPEGAFGASQVSQEASASVAQAANAQPASDQRGSLGGSPGCWTLGLMPV